MRAVHIFGHDMVNRPLREYDVIRILALNRHFEPGECMPGVRTPATGDIGTVIEIYNNPRGYEVESVNRRGETVWLVSVGPDDLEYEVIGNLTENK